MKTAKGPVSAVPGSGYDSRLAEGKPDCDGDPPTPSLTPELLGRLQALPTIGVARMGFLKFDQRDEANQPSQENA